MALVDALEALERKALAEGDGQGDERLDRKLVAVEAVLIRGALECLAQHATPFIVHARHPRKQLRMTPGQRLELHPDLRVAGLEVLLLEAPGGAPLLDE